MNTNTIKDMYVKGMLTTEQVILMCITDVFGDPNLSRSMLSEAMDERKKQKSPNRRWTAEEKDTLKTLYEGGVSRKEIANALGISQRQINGQIGAMRLLRPKTQTA